MYRLSPEMQAMYDSIMTKLPGYNDVPGCKEPCRCNHLTSIWR